MRFICSDSDYSFIARSRGWDVHIVPTVRAEHSISGSGKSAEYDINVIKVKDVIYFYEKWISGVLYARISYEGPSLNISKLESWVQGLQSEVEMTSSIK
jgi:GT2 family glycosyltransferase